VRSSSLSFSARRRLACLLNLRFLTTTTTTSVMLPAVLYRVQRRRFAVSRLMLIDSRETHASVLRRLHATLTSILLANTDKRKIVNRRSIRHSLSVVNVIRCCSRKIKKKILITLDTTATILTDPVFFLHKSATATLGKHR